MKTVEKPGAEEKLSVAKRLSLWLDRSIIGWLFMMAIFAPHSIAVTQIAWGCGLLLWAVRYAIGPRELFRTPLDYALLGFFLLTALSSFLSYEPFVSIGKLRAASLFTIVYLVAENVRSTRVLRLLVLTLVASCTINVVYTLGQRIVGRGVKVEQLSEASPLYIAGIRDGDTLLEVDGRPLRTLRELYDALAGPGSGPALVKDYRVEIYRTFSVPRGQLLEGTTTLATLGVGKWSRGRDWRASGFYGHYVTYAEALQLIASLAFGLFIALPLKRSRAGALLLAALAGFGFAMILTVTRASWLALLVSACVIVLAGATRRVGIIIAACVLLIVPVGLYVLQQERKVSFLDQRDESIRWRETVWHEGLDLLKSRPRHLLVGVGMDSIKSHWRRWGLFDGGRLPVGHMHSDLLQLAVERGIPALLVWLTLLFIYARMLWRLAREAELSGWIERGLALGALGGLAGFFSSGLVHYNFGDSEVVMILYFIMGLTLVLERHRANAKS